MGGPLLTQNAAAAATLSSGLINEPKKNLDFGDEKFCGTELPNFRALALHPLG